VFTGIIEGQGTVVRLDPVGGQIELGIDVGDALAEGVGIGESIALDGCCMTVTAVAGSQLGFQAMPETLQRTALSSRSVGDHVNVERALRADGRLDGHIVQGHVDGTGVIREIHQEEDDVRMQIACAQEIARLLVPKGSVAVDGVSLTVVDSDLEGFSVALIPHTLKVTTLGVRRAGDRVNIEVDVLGKYVYRYLEQVRGPN
jgi:riboflavin synthase